MKYGVDVDATLDTRLLTEAGRKDIKDDIITVSAITNATKLRSNSTREASYVTNS